MKDLKSYGRLTPEERKKIRKFCVFADDFYSGSDTLKRDIMLKINKNNKKY